MKPALALLSASLLLSAASPLAQPSGWGKTSWGMTQAQIKQAYPGEAVDLPPAPNVQFNIDGREQYAQVGIGSTTIEGTEFSVSFILGPAGLQHVIITPRDKVFQTRDVYASLQRALAAKYGEPFANGTAESGVGTTISQWKTKTSIIQLRFVDISSIGTKFLTLSYDKLLVNDKL